jgi:hypothetical protein
MKLAFYKVDNSLEYGRHEFDTISDKPEEILEKLRKLPDEEWHLYDISSDSFKSRTLNLCEFVEDYNDEELDGGWWCVMIPEKRMVYAVFVDYGTMRELKRVYSTEEKAKAYIDKKCQEPDKLFESTIATNWKYKYLYEVRNKRTNLVHSYIGYAEIELDCEEDFMEKLRNF